MNTNTLIDFNRLKCLIIRHIWFNYKVLLIASGAVAGLLMFTGTMMLVFSDQTMDQRTFLGIAMPYFFVGGLLFSSVIYNELNSPHRGYLYLTLPASAFEKLLAAWLVSSIFYPIFITVVLYILNGYYLLVGTSFAGKSVDIFNVFSSGVLKVYAVNIVIQSIFLLGALYFRRVSFLKTILSLFILSILVALYSGILSKLLFLSASLDKHWMMNHFDFNNSKQLQYIGLHVISPMAKILFWGCTAPFFLVVSYFRLKEREV